MKRNGSLSKQSGLVAVEWVIIVLIISILALASSAVWSKFVGINTAYSEGERTGVVTKLSKKGYFWKTWEGEMNLGGMSDNGGGTAVPNVWKFSVTDEAVVQQMLPATTGAKRVTLKYTEVWKSSFAQGETDYLITGMRSE